MFRLRTACYNCKTIIFWQRRNKRSLSHPLIHPSNGLTKKNPGLNRMLEAIEITDEDLKTIKNIEEEVDYDEQDYDNVVLQTDKIYDSHRREEKSRKAMIKSKIIERKYFKSPKEPNLLTWAAKEQIRYLYNEDPKEWPPERLAQCFPISEEGVKKLLKSKFTTVTCERQLKHDQAVVKNWRKILGSSGGPISTAINQLKDFKKEEILFLKNASGNPNLPMPLPLQVNDPMPAKAKKPGEFSTIVKHYLERKNCKSENSQEENIDNMENVFIDDANPEIFRNISGKKKSLITAEQFKQTLKKRIENLKATEKSSAVVEFEKWLNEEKFLKQISQNKLKEMQEENSKYQENTDSSFENSRVELKWDVREEVKQQNVKEAYIYDNEKGYQRPLGMVKESEDKIHIPVEKYKRNATYRVRDNYYDEDGEFLYKVPGLSKE